MKKKTIQIEEKIWKSLINATYHNIKYLLKSSYELLEINIHENKELLSEHPWISAGLYTYAIEEYGKLLYLQSCKVENGKVEIDYRKKFINHDFKFETAIEDLPRECSIIGKSFFDPNVFDSAVFDTKQTISTFRARLGIFYTDLNEYKNDIQMVPRVDIDSMKRAISKFTEIIEKLSIF